MRPLFFFVVILLACVASAQIPVVPDIATIPRTDGNFVVGDGTKFVGESGATARASLGLGTLATQAASAVAITGGAIDGVAIGATTLGTGKFTTLQSGELTIASDTKGLKLDAAGGTTLYSDGTAIKVNKPLDITGNLKLEDTTADTKGVVFKGATRFFHNFHHPTGNTAVPTGLNVFIGENAGNFTMGSTATNVSHGSFNLGVGAQALVDNTTGYANVAIGNQALVANTTGTTNVGIGRQSLYSNIAASSNVGIGYQSLYFNTGANNCGIGTSALAQNTTGTYQTGLGFQAGYFIADGTTANATSSYGVYLGANTKASASGAQNETVIGYNAVGSGNNTVTLGNSNVTKVATTGKLDTTAGIEIRPGASETPTANGDLVIEATSNTALTFKLKGSDGTVRKATLTLAP